LTNAHSRLLSALLHREPNEPITASGCNKTAGNEPIIEPTTNPLPASRATGDAE
jgi:hypothetical protein